VHAEDIAYIERKASGAFSYLSFLDSRYRAIRRRWKGYRLSSYSKPVIEQATDMKVVERYRAGSAMLRDLDSEARDLFGALWQGGDSDWKALGSYIDWVVEFRQTCAAHTLGAAVYEVAAQQSPDTSAMADLEAAFRRYTESLHALLVQVEWPTDYFANDAFEDVRARAAALESAVHRGPEWAAFEACRKPVASGVAAELLSAAVRGELEFAVLAVVFRRAFLMKWLGAAVRARPPLERFHSLTHEQRVKEFQELDTRVLRENQAALVQQLRDLTQQRLKTEEARRGLAHLRGQLNRQRNISPLRRTMQLSGAAIQAVKPCFMMSPMTVAQLLSGAEPTFDVVIFDEASQLPTEDAVGAIIRGRQLLVVGDPKQLPPTNFFAVTIGQTVTQMDEVGNPLFDDSESVLEEFMGAGVPISRLKWHYRSAHETLIGFSNVSFYDSELYTFPSILTDTSVYGLRFEYVADGRYEGKGLNLVEARRVVDEVVRFAREQAARERRGERPLSLGVGTFNLRQQLAIQDELEQRRRQDPLIEAFFSRSAEEPFFVKNLENIQGDERDVIFLSVTYGPGTDGKIRYNFGPLNGENGWRRLNVLVTRARQRMVVFSSMRGEEIKPSGAVSGGPQLLRDFLTFAEYGRLDGLALRGGADTESPFEHEVATELTRRGIRVVPQVGTSGYRIDLGVLDDEVQGRFLCGIECDGVAYHASETARDRDRLWQQVLEARGWTIHRVWSTDWFKDRQSQIERLVRLIERERTHAREQDEAEREARLLRAREAEAEAQRNAEAQQRQQEEVGSNRLVDSIAPYERPTASPYVFAGGQGGFAGQDILLAADARLLKAIGYVVEIESPIHEEELHARVAAMWDTRIGSRVRARIERECASAERNGLVERRGQFYWRPGGACPLRSRAGMRAQAERIAPEEYEQALLAILASGHSFPRAELVMEVRAVLGFNRTGAVLEQAINAVVERLLAEGTLGEGSAGLRLRGQNAQVD
jgi:very-short-patch-repair endonuclease